MQNESQKPNLNPPDTPKHIGCKSCKTREQIKSYAHLAAIILLVVALGFLLINQATSFFLKAHLAISPCQVCKQANPAQSMCIDSCFTQTLKVFEDPKLNLPPYLLEE